MTEINRRTILRALVAAPVAAGMAWTDAEASIAGELAQGAQAAAQKGVAFAPKFFTPHELQTVRLLVDLIIPKDERSGSATDAGVPEFMDFMMIDQPARQVAMRGGLAWLDLECEQRFDKRFLDGSERERAAVLDDIAWPLDSAQGRPHRAVDASGTVRPDSQHGIAFFNSFRDLTATGFWTTKMGIEDLRYMGNRSVARWNGCPDDALKKLGVSY
jgi:gluconate 2-dehydrogenase subunit 3-like protein